jgi:hypothetical protein
MEGTVSYSGRHKRASSNRRVRKDQYVDRATDPQNTVVDFPVQPAQAESTYPQKPGKRRRHAS